MSNKTKIWNVVFWVVVFAFIIGFGIIIRNHFVVEAAECIRLYGANCTAWG